MLFAPVDRGIPVSFATDPEMPRLFFCQVVSFLPVFHDSRLSSCWFFDDEDAGCSEADSPFKPVQVGNGAIIANLKPGGYSGVS